MQGGTILFWVWSRCSKVDADACLTSAFTPTLLSARAPPGRRAGAARPEEEERVALERKSAGIGARTAALPKVGQASYLTCKLYLEFDCATLSRKVPPRSLLANFLARTFMNRFQLMRAVAALVCVLCSRSACAQSEQAHSLQASFLVTTIRFNGSNAGGNGFEGQFRFNHTRITERGVLSIGVGGQTTQHELPGSSITIAGAFIEPRFAFAGSSSKFFPYVSARLAVLRQSSPDMNSTYGGAVGAGAGFAYAINTRTNLDIGAGLLVQTFATTTVSGSIQQYAFKPFPGYAAKAGISLGLW